MTTSRYAPFTCKLGVHAVIHQLVKVMYLYVLYIYVHLYRHIHVHVYTVISHSGLWNDSLQYI